MENKNWKANIRMILVKCDGNKEENVIWRKEVNLIDAGWSLVFF